MIALPLVWVESTEHEYGQYFFSGPYSVVKLHGASTKAHAAIMHPAFVRIGQFATIAEAIAASERHHQVTAVRGLSADARDALGYFVDRFHPDAIDQEWLDILDEADAADRAEQEGKT